MFRLYILFFVLISFSAFSQEFESSVKKQENSRFKMGVRLGEGSGLSFNYSVRDELFVGLNLTRFFNVTSHTFKAEISRIPRFQNPDFRLLRVDLRPSYLVDLRLMKLKYFNSKKIWSYAYGAGLSYMAVNNQYFFEKRVIDNTQASGFRWESNNSTNDLFQWSSIAPEVLFNIFRSPKETDVSIGIEVGAMYSLDSELQRLWYKGGFTLLYHL